MPSPEFGAGPGLFFLLAPAKTVLQVVTTKATIKSVIKYFFIIGLLSVVIIVKTVLIVCIYFRGALTHNTCYPNRYTRIIGQGHDALGVPSFGGPRRRALHKKLRYITINFPYLMIIGL